MIELVCPQCRAKKMIEESQFGARTFQCARCNRPFELAMGAAPAPVSAMPMPPAPPPPVMPQPAPPQVKAPPRKVVSIQKGPSKAMLIGGMAAVSIGAVVLGVLIALIVWPSKPAENPSPQLVAGPKNAKDDDKNDADAPVDIATLTIGGLVKVLAEGSTPERNAALGEIAKRGDKANAARAGVVALLKDPDPETKTLAQHALTKLGSPTADDRAIYAEALRDPSPLLRSHAAGVLGDMGIKAKGELVLLRVLTLDDDAGVRDSATKAVAIIEDDVVGELIGMLRDPSPSTRSKAAKQLGEIGASALPALPNLIDAMADSNAAVRSETLNTLYMIGPPAVTALGESLRDKNLDIRLGAIHALGKMGPDARPVLPDLVRGVTDPNAKVKTETLVSLKEIGDYAVPYLASALEGEKAPAAQKPFLDALGRMGPAASPILAKAAADKKADAAAVQAAIKKVEMTPAPPPRKELMGTAGLIMAELRGWFNTADSNKDNILDQDELTKAIGDPKAKPAAVKPKTTPSKEPMKAPSFNLKMPDAVMFLNRVDRDNDGKISRNEYELWAYDYAEFTKKELDERQRLQEIQQKLQAQQLSQQMRVQAEMMIAQTWYNYHAANRAAGQMAWMQRFILSRLPRR